MTDWSKRARELLSSAGVHVFGPGAWKKSDYWYESLINTTLQIGQEMADARAEEIAKMCESLGNTCEKPEWFPEGEEWARGLRKAAEKARSTISKPNETREQYVERRFREVRDEVLRYLDRFDRG